MHSNKVILLGYYGGDKTHCLSAWQSTNLELGLEMPEDISERIPLLYQETVKGKKKTAGELLRMLAEHGHHTPFEKSTLHFQLTGDIASHIHMLKHRVGLSINGESARYKELEDKWLVPSDWEIPVEVTTENEPWLQQAGMDLRFEFTWADVLHSLSTNSHHLYHEALRQLTPELGRKRAKESARYFFPYAKQLDFDAMFNFRSFMHFVKLRGAPQAQQEIQDIAHEMVALVKALPDEPFALSLEAFNL